MNICIVSTYSCTFDDFSALVKESEEAFREFITEYEVCLLYTSPSPRDRG